MMAAYLMVRVEVKDPQQFQKYLAVSPRAVAKYHGRYLARGGETVTLEGPEEKRRMVLIEFPSLEQAQEFYHSEEYQAARELRQGAAIGEMIVVDGI